MKGFSFYILIGLLTAVFYFAIAIFLLNPALVSYTFFSNASLLNKITLLSALVESSWTALEHTDFFLLMTTSLLVGINISLSLKLIKRLRQIGKLSFAFGGGSMFGIFSAGCASCGISAFSLLGSSGTVGLLPLGGAELYTLAISLLLFSLYYNIKHLQKPLVCKT